MIRVLNCFIITCDVFEIVRYHNNIVEDCKGILLSLVILKFCDIFVKVGYYNKTMLDYTRPICTIQL